MANFDSSRTARWVRTLNLVLQAVLFSTLCLGINYLAQNHVWRRDLTKNRRYSLSAETLSYLKNLDRAVHVIVTLTPDSDDLVAAALPDVRGLLREYAFSTAGNLDPKSNRDGRISVDYLDVYQRRAEAAQLGISQPNVVVFICGDKQRVVTLTEIFNIKSAGGQARIDSFKGEQVFTDALLDVTNVDRKKIYFLFGEGELRIDDPNPASGLSELATELRQRNFAVESLDLGLPGRKIPDDTALLVVAGPVGVATAVQEQLRQYLGQRAGRMLLMLRQDADAKLDDLLYDWGVWVNKDLICDDDPAAITENGDLRIRFFASHPVTQSLIDQDVALYTSAARSLRPEPGRANTGGLKVTVLAASSETAWGETSTRPFVREFSPLTDIKGNALLDPPKRLGIIAAAERGPLPTDLSFSVKRGRLIVAGSTDIATNRRLSSAGGGNLSFILNAINWAAGRDSQLSVPARPVERYQLSLSQQELVRLRFSLLFVLPGGAALLGILVYWSRRT